MHSSYLSALGLTPFCRRQYRESPLLYMQYAKLLSLLSFDSLLHIAL